MKTLKPYVWHSVEEIDFSNADIFDDSNTVILGFWARGYDSYTKIVSVSGLDFFDEDSVHLKENPDSIMIIYDPIGTTIKEVNNCGIEGDFQALKKFNKKRRKANVEKNLDALNKANLDLEPCVNNNVVKILNQPFKITFSLPSGKWQAKGKNFHGGAQTFIGWLKKQTKEQDDR